MNGLQEKIGINVINIYMKKKIICGIYKITNTINDKCYIGKAKNIYKRFWSHKNESKKEIPSRRASPGLFRAIKKYGIEVFTFEILEEVELNDELLKVRELYWQDYFNSYENCCGYNLRRDSETKMIVHEKTSEKISNRLKEEWKNGARSQHSDKMRAKWDGNEERKKYQGELFSEILTKYIYNLFDLDGNFIKVVLYKELKEMGLQNCIATMHRKKSNKISFKGYIIEKVLK